MIDSGLVRPQAPWGPPPPAGPGGRGRRRLLALALVLVSVALVVAYRGPLGRAALAAVLDLGTGFRVAFDDMQLSSNRLVLRGVVAGSAAGEPLLQAAEVSVRYDLHDALFGGAHRFGLLALRVERPALHLIRRADGSFNAGSLAVASPGGPAATAGAPLRFSADVDGGSLELSDPSRKLVLARELTLEDVGGHAAIDTAGRTTYALTGRLGGFRDQPVRLAGRIDAGIYAVHRLRARAVAVAPLADYVINAPNAALERGVARDLDVRAYAFGSPRAGLGPYHLSGGARLENGSLRLPGLLVAAQAMNGHIAVFDGGIATPDLTARLGGIGVRVRGGIYDWSAPAFRLGIVAADAPLTDLRSLFAFSRRLPLGGRAHVETFLESRVGAPLVATAVRSSRLTYGTFPLADVTGRAIYAANAVDLAGIAARYGGLGLGVRGAIALGPLPHTQLVVDAAGPSDGVPYAAEIIPGAALRTTALLEGDALRLDARGVAAGRSATTAVASVFHVDPSGGGAFGPIALTGAAGANALGAFYLNRHASESGFWVDARGVPFARIAANPRLPSLALVPPVFGGTLDGAFAGVGPPSAFRVAGRAHAAAALVGSLRIDDVRADVAGTLASLHLGSVVARGPWGAFSGSGAYTGAIPHDPLAGTLALRGAYRGTFARLRPFTGEVAARGAVAGPVALLVSPARTVVQALGARSPGATIRGVPVDGIRGTVAVAGKRVRVFSATADLAGGAFAAAGSADGARGVGVSVAGADARRLRGLTPLGGGRIAAIGRLRAGGATRFDGGVAIGEASLDRLPLDGNGDVALAGTRLGVSRTDAVLGAALGSVAGTVAGVGSGAPRYALGLHVAALRVAPFARAMAPDRGDLAGTLTGDLAIGGTPATLRVAGTLAAPEGTLNGLSFDDLALHVAIDPAGLAVRRGHVLVGSTAVSFGARFAGNDASMRIVAPHADLDDFNDYFDAGDTLGGAGSVDVRFRKHGTDVRTRAALEIEGLRYRRFELGRASAHWTSSGPHVRGALSVGGASGRLATAGTLTLATRAPLAELLGRSSFAGTATLRGLDLGTWLPVLGYQVPVGGRVDADARIAGRLADPDVETTASLRDGVLGKFPVDRLTLAATSTLRRTHVTQAELDLPSATITGSGSFGFGERDALALSVHGKSGDVGPLAARVYGQALPLRGALEADVKIDGSRAKPRVTGGFDLEAATFHGVAVPQALGELSVAGRDIVLSDAEVRFAKGTLFLAGSVPLQVAPFGFGPAAAPITLDFNAKAIDLSNFAPLLPDGSTLAGSLGGHIAVGGTAGTPRIDGSAALSDGTLRTPFETIPLQHVAARVNFAGQAATLDALHAEAGGGTLDAEGAIQFDNLVRPGVESAYFLDARAKRLRLDVPAFVSGLVDGSLSLSHKPEQRPQLAATLALDDATIPFSALLLADSSSGGASLGDATAAASDAPPAPGPLASAPDIGLALDLSAERNVRVRSANVDIGAHGLLHVAGTPAAPVLTGSFASTGGTLSYFNTVFRLLDGEVAFAPDLGVIPDLDARAITHVLDADPNVVRNVTGSADITLDVHGPVNNLTIGLSSDPSYDRAQILGLLLSAPALGASNLFGDNRAQAQLYGTTAPLVPQSPLGPTRTTAGEFSVAQEAFGIANAQFTRTLLAPIETSVADAIGLTNINVNVDYTGNVGLTARKVLGKEVNAIYGTSFGYPYRQTFGFEIKPAESTAAQVTVFETLGAYGVDSLTPTTYLTPVNARLQSTQPSQGTAGFSISLQHFFR